MLVHSRASSAPAACGSRTEIAPTVAPHRNSSPAARAITRPPSEAREGTWAALKRMTGATAVLSTAPPVFPTQIPQMGDARLVEARALRYAAVGPGERRSPQP